MNIEELVYVRHGMRVRKTHKEYGVLWEMSGCDFCTIKIFEPKTNRDSNSDRFEVTLTTEGQQMRLENGDSSTLKFSIIGSIEFEEFIRGMALFAKVRHD